MMAPDLPRALWCFMMSLAVCPLTEEELRDIHSSESPVSSELCRLQLTGG